VAVKPLFMMMLLLEARPYFVFDQFVFLCHIVYFAFMHSNLNAPLASQHPCHVSIATLELKFNSVFICTKRKLKNSEQQQAKLVAAVEAAVFCLPLLGSALRTSLQLNSTCLRIGECHQKSAESCETALPFDILRQGTFKPLTHLVGFGY